MILSRAARGVCQNTVIIYANEMHCYAKVCENDSLSAKRTKKASINSTNVNQKA